MKSMVGLAIVLLFVGVAYVLIKRPTVAPKTVTGPSTSNAVFGVIGSLGSNLINALSMSGNKIGAPSAVTGQTSTYDNLSTSDLDSLRAGDQAQGVEGPY
jgi:hypothetical protein